METIKIKSKKIKDFSGKVYDLNIEEEHTYSINDCVVHNSGCGSLVLYLLGITRLDPIKYGLLFERFLSDHRSPDCAPEYFGKDIEKNTIKTSMTHLKDLCLEALKKYPELKNDFIQEYMYAKNFYKNGIDLLEAFKENEITGKYIIPFLLGYTDTISKKAEMAQIFSGASGGIDVDIDFSSAGRDVLFEYLKNKYGEDKVFSVGTYSRLGIKSAIKDVLRVYKVDFKESNLFTGKLDSSLSFDENIDMIQNTYPNLFKFYKKHQEIIDLAKGLDGKIRQISKHAGGVIILDRPVYELIPVERVSGTVLTAFPESGSDSTLDELGIIKFDMLSISVLDVIKNTITQIEEDIYLIEDDDGITKMVPESYVRSKQEQ